MSDVNSLFKKKKGKSKALDLKAASAPKKPSKTKAEKQKEAAEDDEWKTETKKVDLVLLRSSSHIIFWVCMCRTLIVFFTSLLLGCRVDQWQGC